MAARRQLAARVVEIESDPRDFVMARLAAARAAAAATIEAIDDAVNAFINPETDSKGRERKELIESALESSGTTSRALESAEAELADFDKETWAAREPWEEEGEEGDDDEDDDEEDDDDDD